jgi:hypothetical protein
MEVVSTVNLIKASIYPELFKEKSSMKHLSLTILCTLSDFVEARFAHSAYILYVIQNETFPN